MENLYIYNFLFGLVAAVVCAVIANSKGRSGVGWFFGGFFLGIIGIIIIACLSNLKQEAAKRQMASRKRRQLREQLQETQMETAQLQSQLYDQQPAMGLDELPDSPPAAEEEPKGYQPPSAMDELVQAISDR